MNQTALHTRVRITWQRVGSRRAEECLEGGLLIGRAFEARSSVVSCAVGHFWMCDCLRVRRMSPTVWYPVMGVGGWEIRLDAVHKHDVS
jgi:hypothetical protein